MPQSRLTQVVRLIERRRARRARQQRSASQRVQALAALLLGTVSVALALVMLAAPQAYAYFTRDLPALDALPLFFDAEDGALLQPTIFYDRAGQELWRLENPEAPRQFIDMQTAPLLANALVASRDPDYWTRALFSLEPLEADPGIAAELVQEFLFSETDSGWLHALRVRLLAAQLLERFGRHQVLSWYANSRIFGHYAVGVEAAAQLYFGKGAAQLSLAEATLLAPVAQAPALNPIDAGQLAVQRQQALLLQMLDQGLADDDTIRDALVESITLQAAPEPPASAAPDFTELALAEVEADLGFSAVQRGGLDVHTSLDLGLQRQLEASLAAQAGAQAVVLDAATGQVLAMLGRADLAQRAPGSTLSPFVYLSAFARGQAPAALAWDAPSRVLDDLEPYSNPDGVFHGPVTLRQALANDYLVVSMQLLDSVGPETAWNAARQSGVHHWDGDSLEGLLGAERAGLLEVTQAYGTLANLGVLLGQADQNGQITASTLRVVIDPLADVLLDGRQPQRLQVLAPELAYLVNDVLSDVGVRQAQGWRQVLGQAGRPAALQIGRVQGEGSLWAVGYSPQRVVALWLPQSEGAEEVWRQAFQLAHAGLPIQSWPAPSGLASSIVCVPGGLLPGPDCPETRRELFLSGSPPTASDNLYQRVAINTQNRLLATVFSPLEFVQEELVLDVPADIEAWARAAGLPVAPADYDNVLLPSPGSDAALISSPQPFSQVGGLVSIQGSTGSAELASYRVLVGQGLYPQQWIEIARGQAAVQTGLLATWDSSGLSGAYAIQLQVLHTDGSLERAYTLVTLGE